MVSAAMMVCGLAVGCTTVHVGGDSVTGDSVSLEAPARMERVESSEESSWLLRLVDPRDGAAVEIFAVEELWPDALLGIAFAELFGATLVAGESGVHSFEDERGGGWVYAARGERQTYFLAYRGGAHDGADGILRLVEGFEYPPAGELPEVSLGAHLGEESTVKVPPRGVDGELRQARVITVEMPSRLTRGYLLSEPLTRGTTAAEYLDHLVSRLDVGVEGERLDLSGDCECEARVVGDGLVAAMIVEDRALQLRLESPEEAGVHLAEERRRWAEEFFAEGAGYLTEE